MRYLFLRENVLVMNNIRFHRPENTLDTLLCLHKIFRNIRISALTIVIRVKLGLSPNIYGTK